jgi:hypothetical protein
VKALKAFTLFFSIAMGRVKRGVQCSIHGCSKPAVRSISVERVKAAGLEVEGRRAYLCEEHYKEYKKRRKREKLVEKWRYKPF